MTRPLRKENAPAERGVVFLCEKCGKGADFSSKDLKNELRSALKDRGEKGAVRVVLTSCMDLCPKDGIAAAIAPTAQGKPAEFFVAGGRLHEAGAALLDHLP